MGRSIRGMVYTVVDSAAVGDRYIQFMNHIDTYYIGPDGRVYFCAEFDNTPDQVQLFSGQYTDPYWPNSTEFRPPVFTKAESIIGNQQPQYGFAKRIGALFTFPSSVSMLKSRIGVSFISSDNACQHIEQELPTWDLQPVIAAAKEQWNKEVLSKVTTTDSNNDTLLEMLYSSLYKMHLMPSDRTGENPNWETEEPTYDVSI